MFTEHVLLNHGNMITYARRLNIVSGEGGMVVAGV